MNEIIPKIGAELFLKEAATRVILDVRSPAEYAKGHIPDAHSFPLFTDEERAVVGTLYSKSGREAAYFAGLDIVGPKMSDVVKNSAFFFSLFDHFSKFEHDEMGIYKA